MKSANAHTHTQSSDRHDRALLNTLLLLIGICILVIVFGKAEGYGQSTPTAKPATDQPKSTAVATNPAPKPATPTPAPPVAPPAAPPSPYQPTEAQADKLRIGQLEAINAQQAWNTASQKLPEYQLFNQALTFIGDLCNKVRAANKWPEDVKCDINQNPVTFVKQQPTQSTQLSTSQPVQVPSGK